MGSLSTPSQRSTFFEADAKRLRFFVLNKQIEFSKTVLDLSDSSKTKIRRTSAAVFVIRASQLQMSDADTSTHLELPRPTSTRIRSTKDRQSSTFCSAADSRSPAWTPVTKISRGDSFRLLI